MLFNAWRGGCTVRGSTVGEAGCTVSAVQWLMRWCTVHFFQWCLWWVHGTCRLMTSEAEYRVGEVDLVGEAGCTVGAVGEAGLQGTCSRCGGTLKMNTPAMSACTSQLHVGELAQGNPFETFIRSVVSTSGIFR